MLPYRKRISSYVGMGVAVNCCGEARKLKILEVLTRVDDGGTRIVGLRLDEPRSMVFADRESFFLDGKQYILPEFVYRNLHEAMDAEDEAEINGLREEMDAVRTEQREAEKTASHALRRLEELSSELCCAERRRDARKWRRPSKKHGPESK